MLTDAGKLVVRAQMMSDVVGRCGGVPVPNDVYLQPDAPDPVLSEEVVLSLVRRHVPDAHAVTAIDESGGEARAYAIDAHIILKTQRPHRLRARTSLAKEVFFLNRLASEPGMPVPRVLGYGHEGSLIEYTCMTRMPGVAMIDAVINGPPRAVVLADLGRMLRRIHMLPQEPFVTSGLFPRDDGSHAVRARLSEHFSEVVANIQAAAPTWTLPLPPENVAACALAALPDMALRAPVHSNPGPPHTFIDPATMVFTGLIDFGDAYLSHPALDLWRWADPADRHALFHGYTAEQSVDDAFLQIWRVVQVLADLRAIASTPILGPPAQADLWQHLSAGGWV